MKILVALDTKDYSKKIVRDVARLAENTLADIVFLGIQESAKEPEKYLTKALTRYQQDVYSYFSPDELPYADFSSYQWQEKAQGDWAICSEGMKGFTLKIRSGSVAKQTITVAKEMECNLIIIGCSSKCGCEWDGEMNIPLRIAEDAPCSVLVIKDAKDAKDAKNTNDIISILDQSAVSQDALEMVNQLATLHDAGLKIVGVKEKKEDKKDQIEKRMVELLRYYNDRKINTWIKVLDSHEVKDYVTSSSREAIIALWMGGKQSLVQKLFTKTMVDKLLETTKSSLFILR